MLARMVRALDRLVEGLAVLTVVTLLVFVTLGIVTRAIGRPLAWTDEMSGFAMVWLSCLGWMIATRRGAHIRIRYFRDKLPGGGQAATEMAVQAGLAVVGLVVLWGGIHLVRVNHDIEAVSIPVSVGWLYAPLVPAGLVTLVQALADLITRRAVRPAPTDLEPAE